MPPIQSHHGAHLLLTTDTILEKMPKCQWSGIGRSHTHFSINKTFYIIQGTCKEKFLRTVSALWCVVACQCVNNFTGPSYHQLPPAFQSYSSPPINTYNYHPQPHQYPTHILSSILCSVFTGVGMCLYMYTCVCMCAWMHAYIGIIW